MNANELRGKIVANGMNIGSFCERFDFNRSTFDRKLSGVSEFNRNEIERIVHALALSPDEIRNIFFTDDVTEKCN